MAGILKDRARAVYALMDDYDCVTTEFVQAELGCGRGQALRAIRQARIMHADDGRRVSYATAANGYTVAVEDDAVERTLSYTSRLQSINTQQRNAAHVMSAALDHGSADRLERAVARMAQAAALRAEADTYSLSAFRELVSDT